MNIDYDELRKDLTDDRYAASFAGIPEMIMEAWEIGSLSDEELLELSSRSCSLNSPTLNQAIQKVVFIHIGDILLIILEPVFPH